MARKDKDEKKEVDPKKGGYDDVVKELNERFNPKKPKEKSSLRKALAGASSGLKKISRSAKKEVNERADKAKASIKRASEGIADGAGKLSKSAKETLREQASNIKALPQKTIDKTKQNIAKGGQKIIDRGVELTDSAINTTIDAVTKANEKYQNSSVKRASAGVADAANKLNTSFKETSVGKAGAGVIDGAEKLSKSAINLADKAKNAILSPEVQNKLNDIKTNLAEKIKYSKAMHTIKSVQAGLEAGGKALANKEGIKHAAQKTEDKAKSTNSLRWSR